MHGCPYTTEIFRFCKRMCLKSAEEFHYPLWKRVWTKSWSFFYLRWISPTISRLSFPWKRNHFKKPPNLCELNNWMVPKKKGACHSKKKRKLKFGYFWPPSSSVSFAYIIPRHHTHTHTHLGKKQCKYVQNCNEIDYLK